MREFTSMVHGTPGWDEQYNSDVGLLFKEVAGAKANGILNVYAHSKTGTTHALTGEGAVMRFFATAPWAVGDTIAVNGEAVNPITLDGAALPAGGFVSGMWVVAVKDGKNLQFLTQSYAGVFADLNAQLANKANINPIKDEIYVAPKGDDQTGDGSKDNPYATIQKAIDILPKFLDGHNVVIYVADGIYGGFQICYFAGGSISIEAENPEQDRVVVTDTITLARSFCGNICLKGITSTATSNRCVFIRMASHCTIEQCWFVSETPDTDGIVMDYGANLLLHTVQISNKARGLVVAYGATVSSHNLRGQDNAIGVYCWQATVYACAELKGTIDSQVFNGQIL